MVPPSPPRRWSSARARAPGALLGRLRAGDLPARVALACFLWGMLLGPALHLVDHRPDHHHGPGGVVHVHEGAAAHTHAPGDGLHSPHAPPVDDRQLPAELTSLSNAAEGSAPTQPPDSHGAGDGLHFGLALLDTAAPVLVLGPPPAPARPPRSPAGIGPLRRSRGLVLARGPPAAAPALDDSRG